MNSETKQVLAYLLVGRHYRGTVRVVRRAADPADAAHRRFIELQATVPAGERFDTKMLQRVDWPALAQAVLTSDPEPEPQPKPEPKPRKRKTGVAGESKPPRYGQLGPRPKGLASLFGQE